MDLVLHTLFLSRSYFSQYILLYKLEKEENQILALLSI